MYYKVCGVPWQSPFQTRVFVTHGISYLPRADQIVVTKDGRISEVGTFKQLLNRDGDFADFIREHQLQKSREESGEEESEDSDGKSLKWRLNERDDVSNHQPHDCMLKLLFRRRSKKTSRSASLAFVGGIHRWPVNSALKGPGTRKMFPFDDVIMYSSMSNVQWYDG